MITLGLIVINVLAFVLTTSKIDEQGTALAHARVRILMLAATHPDLKMSPDIQQLVTTFRDHNPQAWKQLQNPTRELTDFAAQSEAESEPAS